MLASTGGGSILPLQAGPAQVPGSSQPGGRSPGLILLVAACALVLISLQSLSEVAELLLQHVDDSLLEDGTLFTTVDLTHVKADTSNHQLLYADEDDDDNQLEEERHPPQKELENHSEADMKLDATTPKVVSESSDEPLLLNVGFHYFKDRHNLLRPNLTIFEIEHILQDVQKTWWQGARIVLNFTNNIEEAPILLDDKRADAYRWFVYASKDQKKEKFWKDVYHFLRKGPGMMTAAETGAVIEKYYQMSGHPMMDWLTLPVLYKTHNTVFDILTVKFWPWNNGGQLGPRIFFRSGACDLASYLNRKLRKNELIPCAGWNKAAHDQKPMSFDETSRLISHLVGHFLGLKHPSRSRCGILDGTSPLMCTPKKDAPDDFFRLSRHMDSTESIRARTNAAALIKRKQHEVAEIQMPGT